MNGHERDQQSEDDHKTRRPRLLALCLLIPLALLTLSVLLASQSALGSTNLLSNGGFESGTSDWQPSHTLGITFTTSTVHVHSGQWAASLIRIDTGGEIWIRQDISVVPSATYTLTGWVYMDDANFAQACLRISWRATEELDSVQTCLYGQNDFYRPITLGPVIPPSDTVTARIMAVGDINEASPSNPVYFDDLSFTSNIPPTPTPMAFYVPLVVKNYASGP
jgi:hypothetical protein